MIWNTLFVAMIFYINFSLARFTVKTPLEFAYDLEKVQIETGPDSKLKVSIASELNWNIPGKPSLPVIRKAIALPWSNHNGNLHIDVLIKNVKKEIISLNGSLIQPAQGTISLCKDSPNTTSYELDDESIHNQFPSDQKIALTYTPHVFRDVTGTILEIRPVSWNPNKDVLEVIKHCEIELVSEASFQKLLNPVSSVYWGLYLGYYDNWDSVSMSKLFYLEDKPSRMLILTEDSFKSQADSFASWKKSQGVVATVTTVDSSSKAEDIREKIVKPLFTKEALEYLVIIGRGPPSFSCTNSGSTYGCDAPYTYMTPEKEKDKHLDIIVARLSGNSAQDIENQIDKFKHYPTTSKDLFTRAAGLAKPVAGTEPNILYVALQELGGVGMTDTAWMLDEGACTTRQVLDRFSKGNAIFMYLAHGNGYHWQSPSPGESQADVAQLSNNYLNSIVLSTACLCGGFQKYTTCFAQAMTAQAKSGALTSYSTSPEGMAAIGGGGGAPYLQEGAIKALSGGTVKTIGQMYYAGAMYQYKQAPQKGGIGEYTLEGYQIFGDPSIVMPFAKVSY